MKKLGIIGLSKGNGHPYSWSAIFNGYNHKFIDNCPFSVIPEYLKKETFPESFLSDKAEVTHIWTQSSQISKSISEFSNIPYVVNHITDMIGHIDGVLLARDDAETHFELAKPFLEAGLFVFIDKPLAYSVSEAEQIFNLARFDNQIFTCSSLRYAKELDIRENNFSFVRASINNSWEKYGIHVLEPIVNMFPHRGELINVVNSGTDNINIVTVKWQNLLACINVLGHLFTPTEIELFGDQKKSIRFLDTFYAFKKSLSIFIDIMEGKQKSINKNETMEIISIIEKGRKNG
ncbi:hypothetical protein EZS27_013767 [termite gut metagenome]|uniref:Gfo/Idh/MocA-like oxidoreductase N-terminal domain-containing protein n=1 Tax=termite gut metagenome TaxID=433724 RepID=A0A5J4RYS0_9ZZZZ